MRMSSFSATLVFGAFAALAGNVYLIATRPTLGGGLSVSSYGVLVSALYLVAIAPDRSRGIRLGALALGLGAGMLLIAPEPILALPGAAVLLGLLRSGFAFRARPGRALLIEILLLGGGLLVAKALAGTGGLGLALAVWGFFLVQSAYFLIGGVSGRARTEPGIDAFDRANARAHRLMDDPVR